MQVKKEMQLKREPEEKIAAAQVLDGTGNKSK